MPPVLVERNVPCRLRDCVVLATDVFRPDDDERHPVLLQRTPYVRGTTPSRGPLPTH